MLRHVHFPLVRDAVVQQAVEAAHGHDDAFEHGVVRCPVAVLGVLQRPIHIEGEHGVHQVEVRNDVAQEQLITAGREQVGEVRLADAVQVAVRFGAVGGFWFFVLGAVGEAVWVGVEIYCLYKTVTVERFEMWGASCTAKHAVCVILAQIFIFFVSLNFLRVELGDVSMFKFWIFTQVIIVCAPGLFWRERGERRGACWQLVITLVLVCVLSFNPLGNMWSLISPYFALENNPWYYVMGLGVACFAVYDVYVYAKLPKKSDELLESGRSKLFGKLH